jgi:hypothetical protein
MKYFKKGQIVYHSIHGVGMVISIDDEAHTEHPIRVAFYNKTEYNYTEQGKTHFEDKIVLSQNPIPEIVNKPLEDIYLPFTFEHNLIGRRVVSKDTPCKGVITYQDDEKVIIGYYNKTYEELLKEYTFIEGNPCGKLLKN